MNNITISAEAAARKAREHMRIPSTIIIPLMIFKFQSMSILFKPIKKV